MVINFKKPFLIALSLHLVILLGAFYKKLEENQVELKPPTSKNYIQFSLDQVSQNGKIEKMLKASSKIQTENIISNNETQASLSEVQVPSIGTNHSVEGVNNFEEMVEIYREPIYPKVALLRGLEDKVEVLIHVSKNGQVESIEFVKKSSFEFFNEASIEAIKFWKFKTKNFSYKVSKTIIFKLR